MAVGSGWSAQSALEALLEALDEGAIVFDDAGHCRAAGRRAGELVGVEPRDLVGMSRAEILRRVAAMTSDPALLAPLEDDVIGVESMTVDPIEVQGASHRTLVWTTVPIADGASHAGRVDLIRDVSRERVVARAHEATLRKLEEVSTVDDLTGLVNRRRFESEADREHRRAQRAWAPYAIARVDVDGMQRYNQGRGHPAGDELLRVIGEELRSARREYDLVARFGPDEFVLLLPGADAIAAKIVVKRAVKGVHAKLREASGDVTVSAGAAIWTPPSGESAADIIKRAGDALYSARERAPGSIEIDSGLGQWKDDMSES